MPHLIEITIPGAYNKVLVNPLLVMVVAEDKSGNPYIAFEPHPEPKDRVYVTDGLNEIVAKVKKGVSGK